ncbi:hypothetical protein [Streptomyces enissocaesilis]|uniref:Uncharacterized protein n=1 Tax=Streptomyces enissocaesilis TaxID=332589 RepID=A0ABN3WYF6_9ACTN
MTARPPTPRRAPITDWTHRVLTHAYRGQPPADVIARAVRLLATADGHLDTRGQLTTERAARRQK